MSLIGSLSKVSSRHMQQVGASILLYMFIKLERMSSPPNASKLDRRARNLDTLARNLEEISFLSEYNALNLWHSATVAKKGRALMMGNIDSTTQDNVNQFKRDHGIEWYKKRINFWNNALKTAFDGDNYPMLDYLLSVKGQEWLHSPGETKNKEKWRKALEIKIAALKQTPEGKKYLINKGVLPKGGRRTRKHRHQAKRARTTAALTRRKPKY